MKHFSEGDLSLHIATHILTLIISVALFSVLSSSKKSKINTNIRMNEPKVVDKATIKDLEKAMKANGDKPLSICRCWKSKNWPYCDATHAKLNQAGENVGPFVVLPGK